MSDENKLLSENNSGKRKLISLTELLVIVSIIALLLAVFLPVLTHEHITINDPKPKLPAMESNRIYHPKGFSIIAPESWINKIQTEPNNIERILIHPKFLPELEISTYLDTVLFHDINDVNNYLINSNFKKCKFLLYDAMVFEGDRGRYYRWEAIFSQNERWYMVRLWLPRIGKKYENIPDYWWPFINSFRIEPNEK
jgi:hypothetical protein